MNESTRRRTLYRVMPLCLVTCSFAIGQTTTVTAQLDCSGEACAEPQTAFAMPIPPPMGGAQMGVVVTGGGFGVQEAGQLVKDEPYQAQAVTEMKQTLADGTHIAQTSTAVVARDSDGRTMRAQKLSQIGPWKSSADSDASGPTFTTIFDPVAKTHTDYSSDTKVAHVLTLPALLSGGPAVAGSTFAMSTAGPVGPPANVMFTVQGHAMSSDAGGEKDSKTEQLGTKTIEGIQATGTRTTSTIPAGTIGNDKDIIITHEKWFSPDLKLVILSTQNDPRFGETTYSLKNIERSEPDQALFQIPADYKVEKSPMMLKFMK
jgi:hypothetical protein